ncbi:MAG TPA: EF-P lysine aminoacylase EpmA [Gammaproteobacteria bacterium]|nr:EF-P lysine aminoacylase EpmA [Gammaproteobacteria bacterium]
MSDATDWGPGAEMATLRWRAQRIAQIRAFFAGRGVWEVETPMLSRAGATDPALHGLESEVSVPVPHRRYWHTSPEFAMKRLLAAGSGAIYQLCRVFRDGELGRQHSPEFTLLEWYRPGFDEHDLMDEVAALLAAVLERPIRSQRIAYRDAFRRHADLDPITADPAHCRRCCLDRGLDPVSGATGERDFWLDLLMGHVVGPALGHGEPCFVYDYPASQAALARVRPGPPPVAARFELYLNGVELANGFHELTDPVEQAARFRADLARRRQLGLALPPVDQRLLEAMQAGLPECAGVAVGVDRLLMIAAGADRLEQVLAFPFGRA